MAEPADHTEVLNSLERFVVDDDDLLQLEERIGRFNIFDALRIDRVEIRHSNFLAWLLDPNESHGCADLFLKAMLTDLLRQTPHDARPFNPLGLDGEELRGVEVRREWRHIDLLLSCDTPAFVIAVENKIKSGEHSGQLERYKTIVRESFPRHDAQFVFLTPEGDDPSDDDWTTYTYRDLHRVLKRVRRTNEGAIGDDVRNFLDHYLRLIEARLMDDPEIDELCRRIYKNHRQAIDLIVARAGASGSAILDTFREFLETEPTQWKVLGVSGRRVNFAPVEWLETVPPIADRGVFGKNGWLYLTLSVDDRHCSFRVCVERVTDEPLRQRIVDRLIKDKDEFGLRRLRKQRLSRGWNSLANMRLDQWPEGEQPQPDEVMPKIESSLKKLQVQLAGVPAAIREVTTMK